MGKTVANVVCPQCKTICRAYPDDRMVKHMTDQWMSWGRGIKKIRCRYSLGTWEDAKLGITPLMRKVESHMRRLARKQKRQLTEKEIKQLMEWGIM